MFQYSANHSISQLYIRRLSIKIYREGKDKMNFYFSYFPSVYLSKKKNFSKNYL